MARFIIRVASSGEAHNAAGMNEWQMDILRHGTYRLPILKSADALALEMGNSPEVIFRHYRRPMSEVTAAAYFDIRPAAQPCPTFNHATSDARDESFAKKLIQRGRGNAPGTLDTQRSQAA
jgi:hypothetical protein